MKKQIAAFAALVVAMFAAMALTLPSSASAAGEPIWVANGDSKIVNQNTVRLIGDNTSVETDKWDLDLTVNPTKVTFKYKVADGAVCGGGAPRVFFVVDAVNTNSWDSLLPSGDQCGEDIGENGFKKVTFFVPAGHVEQIGLVYDNVGNPGKVTIKDLTIQLSESSAVHVAFTATVPEATPTATPETTLSPSVSASPSTTAVPTTPAPESPSPSTTATATASPSASTSVSASASASPTFAEPTPSESETVVIPAGNSGGLPVTGSSLGKVFWFGSALIVLGAGALLALKRRDEEIEEETDAGATA